MVQDNTPRIYDKRYTGETVYDRGVVSNSRYNIIRGVRIDNHALPRASDVLEGLCYAFTLLFYNPSRK